MKDRQPFWVLIAMLLFMSTSPVHAKNRALIIGIDQYPHLLQQFQLIGSVNDAMAMKNIALTQLGYRESEVKLLLNKKATRQGILDAIQSWLIDDTQSGDKVFFFYSGHGGQQKDILPIDEDDNIDETLAPSDTRQTSDDEFGNMITDDTLRVFFDTLERKKIEALVVIDSCYSGTITRSLNTPSWEGSMVKTLSAPQPQPVVFRSLIKTSRYQRAKNEGSFIPSSPHRTVWTAASAAQLAFVNKRKRQGVFTQLFIEGLQSASGHDHKVSNAELFNYIAKGSDLFCQSNHYCVNGQRTITPTLEIPPVKRLAAFSQSGFTLPPINEEVAFDSTFSPMDTDTVSVTIKQGNVLSLGDSIRIDIKNTSGKSGQLVLLDRRENGDLVQLYPNRFMQDKHLDKGAKLYIPRNKMSGFSIKASVKGHSEIIAIIVHDDVDLSSFYRYTKDLVPIPKPKVNNCLGGLMQTLQSTWTGGSSNRAVDYSTGKYAYTVQ